MRFQKRTRILLRNCATDHSYYVLPPPNLLEFYLCPRNLNRDNCQRSGLNCFEGEILRSIMYSLYCGTVHCFRENQIFFLMCNLARKEVWVSLKIHMSQTQRKQLCVIVCAGRIGKCPESKTPSLKAAVHFKVQKYLKGASGLGVPLQSVFTCKQSHSECSAFSSQTHRSQF